LHSLMARRVFSALSCWACSDSFLNPIAFPGPLRERLELDALSCDDEFWFFHQDRVEPLSTHHGTVSRQTAYTCRHYKKRNSLDSRTWWSSPTYPFLSQDQCKK